MKAFLILIVMVASMTTMALSPISGIGYCLYLWGSVGLAFSASLWSGFLLWISMLGGGLIGLLISMALGAKVVK